MNHSIGRRAVLRATVATAVGASIPANVLAAGKRPAFKAVAFDGFALFDPTPVAQLAKSSFPMEGARLVEAWRVKQFEYQWLRAVSGQYQDFWRCTEAALLFAARAVGVELTSSSRDRLMGRWLELEPWPDVVPSLKKLRDARLRLAPLANLTPAMLRTLVGNAGLGTFFDEVISTERARTFKPAPRAYQLAEIVLGVRRDEIAFVPSASWDAVGAGWFGLRTFWLNRAGMAAEELGIAPDRVGRDMSQLVEFVLGA